MTLVCGKEVTLPDPENNLDIFNYVKNHLLKQNRRSFGLGICKYRHYINNDTILACAIGCLIPDDKYDRNIEDKPITQNGVPSGPGYLLKEYNLSLLKYLQMIHDQSSVDDWPDRLDILETRIREGKYDLAS